MQIDNVDFLLQVSLLSNLGGQKLLYCFYYITMFSYLVSIFWYEKKTHLKYVLSTNEAALTLLLFRGKQKQTPGVFVILSRCSEWFGHLLCQIMAHCKVLQTGSVHLWLFVMLYGGQCVACVCVLSSQACTKYNKLDLPVCVSVHVHASCPWHAMVSTV